MICSFSFRKANLEPVLNQNYKVRKRAMIFCIPNESRDDPKSVMNEAYACERNFSAWNQLTVRTLNIVSVLHFALLFFSYIKLKRKIWRERNESLATWPKAFCARPLWMCRVLLFSREWICALNWYFDRLTFIVRGQR